MFLSFQKNQKIVSMVQRLKRLFVRSKYILQKKIKHNLTNVQFSKNYVGLISLSQLRNT